MFDKKIVKTNAGEPASRSWIPPLVAVFAALTLLIVMAGPGARKSEAAGIDTGFGPPPVMADYDPSCLAFSTLTSYLDPFGFPIYQNMPIYGNAYALFNQCTNFCAPYGFFGACVDYCPVATQSLYPFGPLVCPGPPASILFAPSPTTATCGSASNLEAVVLDANGLRVLNGTQVSFNTTLGYVSTQDGTSGGIVYTSLTIPPKLAGSAVITATAGNVTAQKLVQVSC
jgi:hypothetical protein